MKKQTLKKSIGRQHTAFASRSAGFTLIEILVVLGIIAVLAALLFPAFRGMQERGRQTNCAANLKQISVAVQQYYQDEKFYPSSLAVIMPQDIDMTGDNNSDTDNNVATLENVGGTAYLPNLDVAICQDDDTESTAPRFSYGIYGVNYAPALPALAGTFPTYTSTPPSDPGQYVWNYWGYRADGYAYQSAQEAATANGTAPYNYLAYKSSAYNHPQATGFVIGNPRNVVEHSLSNRYAPKSTIITHCVYHRLPTANNLNQHSELYYSTDPTAGQGAKDIILLLSGEARTLDVASFPADPTGSKWQTQKF